jgi:hypothetical protein
MLEAELARESEAARDLREGDLAWVHPRHWRSFDDTVH